MKLEVEVSGEGPFCNRGEVDMEVDMEVDSSDAGMDMRGDYTKKLDDDTIIQVLQYLHKVADIANASRVCRSWRRCVLEGQLWKLLCLKEFPEVRMFQEVVETDLTRDVKAAGSSGSSFRQKLEREERIYRQLMRELFCEPMLDKSCIGEAIGASSTDNYPEESIIQTLHPRPRYSDGQTPSYWSSTGQRDNSVPETLTYKLVSQLCVVHKVHIRPFQAFFQDGHPIYSAHHVRIRLGHELNSSQGENYSSVGSGRSPMAAGPSSKHFVWTYESPKFPMEQVDSLQSFKLPHPVVCIGGILQVELLGRAQTQLMDQQYYICICHVSVQGQPLSDFTAHRNYDGKGFYLEYRDSSKLKDTAADVGGKLVVPEGVTATRTWHAFAERIRQLRAGRVGRRNRLLINTLLGNIAVASLILTHDAQESSSEGENDDEEENGEEEDHPVDVDWSEYATG